MKVKFYDKLLELLKCYGVKEIYGVPGDAINPLIDAIRRDDEIRFIHVNHEEGGAFAASAAAKLTGRLQVCAGTVGPGAIHLLNGLYDAKKDHAPVLAIAGQVPGNEIGSSFHQEVDLKELFSDVSAYISELRQPEQLSSNALEACRTALVGRTVSTLVIPHDTGSESLPDFEWNVSPELPDCGIQPAEKSMQSLADAVAESKAITLLVGEGSRHHAEAVFELAAHWNAPIIRSLRAKDIVPEDSEYFAGGLGLLGDRGGVTAMSDADLVLVLGSDFPYREWYNEDCRTFQIDRRAEVLGRRHAESEGIHGDLGPALDWLLKHTEAKENDSHLKSVQRSRGRWEKFLDHQSAEDRSEDQLHPQVLARAVGEAADSDAIFTCDTGAVTVWAARHLGMRRGQRFTLSFNLASMAYALPAAVGAQISHPDRQVVALCGDGGFNMLMGELLIAAKYKLPIKVVIFNNRKLGLIQMEQEAEGLPESETGLQNPDYVTLAQAMGLPGWRVDRPEELKNVLHDAFAVNGPVLVDARVNDTEVTWPPSIGPSQALGFSLSKLKELFGKNSD